MTVPEGPRETGGGGRLPRTAVAAAVSGLVGLIAGLAIGALALGAREPSEQAGLTPRPTTLERIRQNPEAFFGDPAVVSGVVREVLSPRAFTVARPGNGGLELLVATKAPLAAPSGASAERPILEGDVAQVVGEVRPFDVAAFERFSGQELDREFDSLVGDDLAQREGDPAIQASTVTFQSGTTAVVETFAVEQIGERPEDFYGRILAVDGRVTDVLPAGALLIDDEVVALTADVAGARPREGQQVRLVGPVRPFDPDQRRPEAGYRPDADDELLGELENRPAIVARSIEIERGED